MIYFIGNGNGLVKIGYSTNPAARLSNLQTSSPDTLEMLAVIPGNMDKEKEYHKKYADLVKSGEWHYIDGELESEINQLRQEHGDLYSKMQDVSTLPAVKLFSGSDDDLIELIEDMRQRNINVSARIRDALRTAYITNGTVEDRLDRIEAKLDGLQGGEAAQPPEELDDPILGGL